MKLIKIVTQYGVFEVGKENVTDILIHETKENHYSVYRNKDNWNRGTLIEIKCENVLLYWE